MHLINSFILQTLHLTKPPFSSSPSSETNTLQLTKHVSHDTNFIPRSPQPLHSSGPGPPFLTDNDSQLPKVFPSLPPSCIHFTSSAPPKCRPSAKTYGNFTGESLLVDCKYLIKKLNDKLQRRRCTVMTNGHHKSESKHASDAEPSPSWKKKYNHLLKL